MPRFLTGDELGNIKSVRYTPDVAEGEAKSAIKTLYNGKSSGVQVLAITPRPGGSQSVRSCLNILHKCTDNVPLSKGRCRILRWLGFFIYPRRWSHTERGSILEGDAFKGWAPLHWIDNIGTVGP